MSTTLLPTPNSKPRPKKPARSSPACRHCGAPLLDTRMQESGFCCAGCSYVFRLVHEHGLASYYNIKDDVTAPADSVVFQPRDFTWLESLQKQVEPDVPVGLAPSPDPAAPTSIPELALSIQGISCAGCVWLIERLFQQQPGARDIEVNAPLGQLRLRWIPGEFSAVDFARKLQAFGYLLGPPGDTQAIPESRGLVKRIGLCAAFSMNIMLFAFPAYFGMSPDFEYARLFDLLALGFGTLSFLVGGTYFLSRAFRALRQGAMHIDLPIAIGILGAYLGSLYGWFAGKHDFVYFDFVGTFILLMLVGRWAQTAAVERNQRRLLAQQPKPQRIRLISGADTAPEQLTAGQSYFAASGQIVPVESRLDSDSADFSLASINGEAEPRTYRLGQRIPAGAVNLARTDTQLTALQPWSESLLAQLLSTSSYERERVAANSADSPHPLLERVVRGYLIGIIAVAVISGFAWWFSTHDALRTWSVVTAVLVVSCPCAIGLAFPLAEEIATIALRRRGVFVRNTALWPKLTRVRQVIFDKTGTLTLETPVLRNPDTLAALSPEARAALLHLVQDTPHPVSQCLLESLLSLPTPKPTSHTLYYNAPPPSVHETTGQGVHFTSPDGHTWSLGRPGWRPVPSTHCHTLNDNFSHSAESSGTEFVCDGRVLACFHFSDTARPDARHEISALRSLGFSTHILSGDRTAKVTALATELGLPSDHAHGELTPAEKSAWFERHDRRDTLMLGDGANDSLAFDRAWCRGTPVIHRGVLERKADFYYLGRGIGGLRSLFAVNALRRRTQITVLVFSVAYNALAVGLAVAGHMNPIVAAVIMPINSLITLALVTGGMRPAFR